jgi:hypothetical protein
MFSAPEDLESLHISFGAVSSPPEFIALEEVLPKRSWQGHIVGKVFVK